MSVDLEFAYINMKRLAGRGRRRSAWLTVGPVSPWRRLCDPLLQHGICERHLRPWLGSWGVVSSSVTCGASASVSPSAEGRFCRVVVRNGENVYLKKKKKKVVSCSYQMLRNDSQHHLYNCLLSSLFLFLVGFFYK